MVSRQESPQNPSSNMVHQFLISDSTTTQRVNAYCSDSFPQPHGLLPTIHTLGERISTSFSLLVPGSAPFNDSEGQTSRQAHGLSLSLGSHILPPQVQYNDFLVAGAEHLPFSHGGLSGLLSRCSTSYRSHPFGNSKYLKPLQCLLQEVVNVNDKTVQMSIEKLVGKLLRRIGGQRGGVSSELKADLYNRGFLPAEDNELQVKIGKLVALLEELENRYEKYYHEMEEVVCSFEEIAGEGTAMLYTAQALQAMTKHFCCLSDGIVSQIHSTKRKLLHDIHKQNRVSLQQLGFLQGQRHAWRPIRGLPETSVAILRAWLFEHFLHPYPNDPEKIMLASQTGLTKNQVSNWFINARVRLWKPMIEEMYKEEVADSPEECNSDVNGTPRTKEDHSS